MINADDRLIKDDLPNKLGVDAFAVLFAIASHLRSKNRTVWPGITRLRTMCPVEIKEELRPMPKPRMYAAIKRLIDAGAIVRWQDNKDGNFGKTKYKLTTQYLSIWMGVNEFEMQEDRVPEFRNTENRNTENRNTENGYTEAINKREAINEFKTINEIENDCDPEKEFEWFWNTYDYKVSQHEAELFWYSLDFQTMLKIREHLPKYLESKKNTPKRFWKKPINYLKEAIYNDEIVTEEKPEEQTEKPRAGFVLPIRRTAEQFKRRAQ